MTSSPSWRVRLASPTFPDLDLPALTELLNSGWLTNGSEVRGFETAFSGYVGGGEAIGVSSCSAALHSALVALGIGPGDEVITTPITFAATLNAIVHAGATPVLADIEADTLNIDPARVAEAVTPRTRAILAVDFAGQPADLAALAAIKEKHGLALIQDAAHATEALYRGKSIALYGDATCFSFSATKNLPLGEGGMLVLADPAAARAARSFRAQGVSRDAFERRDDMTDRWQHWDLQRPGFNYKMTELIAHLGTRQLGHLEAWHARRADLADHYDARLSSVPGLRALARRPDVRHAHHLYVALLDRPDLDRDLFLPRLRAGGIECTVNYRSVYHLSWYRESYGWKAEDFPLAERASRTCMSLPLHPEMDEAQVDLVVDTLIDLLD